MPRRSVAIVIACALGAWACSGKGNRAAQGRPPPQVSVRRVERRDVAVEVRAPVDLRPLSQADVGSKTLGYLDAVFVDRGDSVKRGQIVALVRPSDLPDQLAAARSALAQAEAAGALARANLERAQRLAPEGIVSQQELQQATTAAATAEASLASARSAAAGMAVRLGETRIDSPLDGVVTQRRLDPGALVGPTANTGSILTVARIDTIRVFVPVNEREVQTVRVGQEARVELDAIGGRSFRGQVVRVTPALDPTTRTVDAEVQIPNAELALKPGMYGRGAIVTGIHANSIVVPAGAVQISNDRHYAFVVNGDRVRRVEVRIGVDGGDWLEVTSGLKPEDEIVIAGGDVLSDNALVKVLRDVNPYTGEAARENAIPGSRN